jgi:hypothetical protein
MKKIFKLFSKYILLPLKKAAGWLAAGSILGRYIKGAFFVKFVEKLSIFILFIVFIVFFLSNLKQPATCHLPPPMSLKKARIEVAISN